MLYIYVFIYIMYFVCIIITLEIHDSIAYSLLLTGEKQKEGLNLYEDC